MSIPVKYIQNYFKRFADIDPVLSADILSNCNQIVVIPCHNEPDLLGALESLLACDPPNLPVEVIVVVNDSERDQTSDLRRAISEVRSQNLRTIEEFKQWNEGRTEHWVRFHLIEALNLPQKTAGVGLARKIGMDEALRRFISIKTDGTIVCLDADCRVSKNYFKEIEKKFHLSSAGLGHVNFKHRWEEVSDPDLQQGIRHYERFLHYYVKGLKSANFPYAIQTIGSCMLVKASVYAKHGGMNRRKAGEDFYFLHKIVPHEEFIELADAYVYPSARTSDRVPFGTGKAQQDWLDQIDKTFKSYDPRVFDELKKLIKSIDKFYDNDVDNEINCLTEIPQRFLKAHEFQNKINSIKRNCKTPDQFKKQFFIWFDGFLCLKFVHWVRDHYYPNIPNQG